MKVVFDTNFLVLPFDKKIDIFNEVKFIVESADIIVFDIVIKELRKVKPRLLPAIEKLLAIKDIKISELPGKGMVDDLLLKYCLENNAAIATIDKELKQKALKQGVAVISIKGKKLEIR